MVTADEHAVREFSNVETNANKTLPRTLTIDDGDGVIYARKKVVLDAAESSRAQRKKLVFLSNSKFIQTTVSVSHPNHLRGTV